MIRLRPIGSSGGQPFFNGESQFFTNDFPGSGGAVNFGTCKYVYQRVAATKPTVPKCEVSPFGVAFLRLAPEAICYCGAGGAGGEVRLDLPARRVGGAGAGTRRVLAAYGYTVRSATFEWDPAKDQTTEFNHGVRSADAQDAFLDPHG